MKRLGFILLFIPLNFIQAQEAFEVFRTAVYPLLKERCASCHGDDQYPLHSSDDVAASYVDARKTINLHFPEESSLWIRSFNNHCAKKNKCDEQKTEFLQAVLKWIRVEKSEIVAVDDGFERVAESTFIIPPVVGSNSDRFVENQEAIKNLTQIFGGDLLVPGENPIDEEWPSTHVSVLKRGRVRFSGDDGRVYSVAVKRLSASYVYLSHLQLESSDQFMSFDGIRFSAHSGEIQSHHFLENKGVFKPTKTPLPMVSKGSGYALIRLTDPSAKKLKVSLYFKNGHGKLSAQQAKERYKAGYFLPLDQLVSRPRVVDITLGDSHTCALLDTNKVKCWGEASAGRLGYAADENVGDDPGEMGNLPDVPLGKGKILKISAGNNHTCAFFENKEMKCWGANSSGELGYGHSSPVGMKGEEMGEALLPVDLGALPIREVSKGSSHSCVLYDEGQVSCWGVGGEGRLGYENTDTIGDSFFEMGEGLPFLDLGEDKVRSLHLANYHSCALFEEGNVKCWGYGGEGGLGSGQNVSFGDDLAEMGRHLDDVDLGPLKVKRLYSGGRHNCAIFEDESMKCWGSGGSGQLGLGDRNSRGDEPDEMGRNLPALPLGTEKVRSLALGSSHTCALFEIGKVKCWGDGSSGVLGNESTEGFGDDEDEVIKDLPYIDFGPHEVAAMATRSSRACAIFKNGRMKCWGFGFGGSLGYGTRGSKGDAPNTMGTSLPFVDLGQEYNFE